MRSVAKVCWMGLVVACSLESPPETESTEQAVKKATVTKIKVDGRSADLFLVDDAGTNGFLNASQDQIANTVALDFSFATPDATDPDFLILFQGAGEIPNSAFTTTATSAHLAVTTPTTYLVNRCVVNTVSGEFSCAPTTPLTFDLTWVKNGIGTVFEHTRRRETLGPVTTKFHGEFTILTANVSGTWAGRSATNLAGNLLDTESRTHIREITVVDNP